MTFRDLARQLRWIKEAEAVIRELESEQLDEEERILVSELHQTVVETKEQLALL